MVWLSARFLKTTSVGFLLPLLVFSLDVSFSEVSVWWRFLVFAAAYGSAIALDVRDFHLEASNRGRFALSGSIALFIAATFASMAGFLTARPPA
jgi:hypothetical protein